MDRVLRWDEYLWNVTVAPDGEILCSPKEPQVGASALLLVRYRRRGTTARKKAYRQWLLYEGIQAALGVLWVVPGAGLESGTVPCRSGDFKFP